MYEIASRATAGTNIIAQAFLFQLKIFNPSNIANGIRLRKAMKALKNPPYSSEYEIGVFRNETVNRAVDRIMLVTGPAMDIFAISLPWAGPAIITAPGEMILKRGDMAETAVNTAPQTVNLNSDQSPLL